MSLLQRVKDMMNPTAARARMAEEQQERARRQNPGTRLITPDPGIYPGQPIHDQHEHHEPVVERPPYDSTMHDDTTPT